jgi:crotonobetainyl-CoA:carnitine CoA-transferase CaiB-like acyl-CoA transferase
MSLPLSGLRVLEVGHILAGPYGGRLLADMGADVIKIESAEGDLSRQVGSHHVDGHNVYFASINHNKRSIHIDLASDEGRAQLGELARTAHALIVNLRPSAIRKLGLDYSSLRRYNPRIVCVAVTAAEWPAFDYIIQAITGIANLTGDPGSPPTLAGYSIVDNSAGVFSALGLLAKVYEGKGGQVDVSLFDIMLSQLNYKAAAYLNGAGEPDRRPLGAHTFYVPAQLFETGDGYLALFVTHDEFWRRLCFEIDRPDWASEPKFATMQSRFTHRTELLDLLSAELKKASAAEWEARLRPLGLAVGAVASLGTVLDSDFVRDRDLLATLDTGEGPLRLLKSPIRFDGERGELRPPPRLHENTDEIVRGTP